MWDYIRLPYFTRFLKVQSPQQCFPRPPLACWCHFFWLRWHWKYLACWCQLLCISRTRVLGLKLSFFWGSGRYIRDCGVWAGGTGETFSWVLFPWFFRVSKGCLRDCALWPTTRLPSAVLFPRLAGFPKAHLKTAVCGPQHGFPQLGAASPFRRVSKGPLRDCGLWLGRTRESFSWVLLSRFASFLASDVRLLETAVCGLEGFVKPSCCFPVSHGFWRSTTRLPSKATLKISCLLVPVALVPVALPF